MRRVAPPRRLLASDGRGWQVCELLDGTIHLTLGHPGLVFQWDEFTAWLHLLEAAARSPPDAGAPLAALNPSRAVSYVEALERYVMLFDQFIIIVSRVDLQMLANLCRKAYDAMSAQRLTNAPSPFTSTIWN